MTEEWRDIKGYEGKYQISNLGNVKSLPRAIGYGERRIKERTLKPQLNHKGYLRVSLHNGKGGDTNTFFIHKLVAMTFIPNPQKYKEIDHINRNKIDNRVENLRWVDTKTNCRNRDSNFLLTINGVTKCASEWSEISGVNCSLIIQRKVKQNWSDEDSVFIPTKRKLRNYKTIKGHSKTPSRKVKLILQEINKEFNNDSGGK